MPQSDTDGRRAGAAVEARRRASIVDRYVAIELPTEEDDARFVAELGLSLDALYRLAAAWRARRDPTNLQGSQKRLTEAMRREAAYRPVDLAGVPTGRRKELAERIAIVQRHLRAQIGDEALEKSGADEMKVSASRFRAITREWIIGPDAASMPGVIRKANRWRRKRGRRRIQELLEAIVAESDPETSVVAIASALAKAARHEGLEVPGKTVIYGRVNAIRKAGRDR